MDSDEPVISSVSVDCTSTLLQVAPLPPSHTEPTSTEDEGRHGDAYDEEDDEDGASSVGPAVAEEDGLMETPSGAHTAVESPATEPAVLLDRDGTRADGESVEAIEAALSNLAVKQQLLARSIVREPQQSVDVAVDPGAGTDEEQQTRPSALTQRQPDAKTTTSEVEEEGNHWHGYPKHFFILSSSGKPIYSYCGDDKSLVGLTALISAVVSVIQSQGDNVRHIRSGSTLIVFMLHGPLYFVTASNVGEPATALKKQLDLLYGQLVLIVTTGTSGGQAAMKTLTED